MLDSVAPSPRSGPPAPAKDRTCKSRESSTADGARDEYFQPTSATALASAATLIGTPRDRMPSALMRTSRASRL